MNNNLEKIYAIVAPIMSPVAVATVTGAAVYAAMSSIGGVPEWMIILGALTFAIAVEMAGGLAFAVISRAVSARSWGAAITGLALAAVYILVISAAANIGAHGGILAATGALPVVAYGGQAAWSFLGRVEERAEAARADQSAKQSSAMEIERMRINERIAASNNAAAIARANARTAQANIPNTVRDVRADTPNIPNSRMNTERLEKARAAYADNHAITARAMAAAVGSSSSDVGKRYLDAARESATLQK